MTRMKTLLRVALWTGAGASIGLPMTARADKPAGAPTAQIRQTNERINKLLKTKKSADDPAAKSEMRAIASDFLDYQELARRSLASHWDGLTPAQRDEFVKTFHEMIERNYEKRLKTDVDYRVLYNDESVSGNEATVSTSVKVKTKGKSTDTAIEYKMKKGDGDRWVVYDIITDEVSMAKTYREQFDKIITQESFDALLKKMRKRIKESDDDAKKAGAGN